MASPVRERLLNDPVDRALELGVQAPRAVVLGSSLLLEKVDMDLHVQAVHCPGASCERLDRGRQAEVVERGGAELGDEMAQPVDLTVKALEDVVDGPLHRLAVIQIARVRQLHPDRADALDALIVYLTRPACALVLARLHPVTKPLDLNPALRRHPLSDACRERAQ